MNRNFRVSFYLSGKNRRRKDGTTPIAYRIHLGTERLSLGTTGYYVDASQWEGHQGRVAGTSGNARYINKQLDTMELDLRAIFRRYEFSDNLSLDFIRAQYLKLSDVDTGTFMGYFDSYIQRRSEDVGHGLSAASLQKYKVTRRRFVEYLATINRKDLKFTELEYRITSGFEHFLRTRNNMVNNSAVRMLKTFKTVVLEAEREGLVVKDPFRGMRMHLAPVDRGYLTEEELEKMMNYNFSIKRLEHVRDFFVFSCFTGLAYVDLANLTTDKIVEKNGVKWIVSRRQKTNVACHVPLLEIPLKILEKYEGQCKDNHVLPVISNQKSNAFLKEIAAVCGIDKNLTCHLARHTFATLALSKGVPVESVSSMLGHTNIRTTQIYARITSKKVEADMEKLAAELQGFGNNYANMPSDKKETSQEKDTATSSASAPVDNPAEQPVARRGRPRKIKAADVLAVAQQDAAAAYTKGRKVAAQDSPKAKRLPSAQAASAQKAKRGRPSSKTIEAASPASAPVDSPEEQPVARRGRPRKAKAADVLAVAQQDAAAAKGRKIAAQDSPKAKRLPSAQAASAQKAKRGRPSSKTTEAASPASAPVDNPAEQPVARRGRPRKAKAADVLAVAQQDAAAAKGQKIAAQDSPKAKRLPSAQAASAKTAKRGRPSSKTTEAASPASAPVDSPAEQPVARRGRPRKAKAADVLAVARQDAAAAYMKGPKIAIQDSPKAKRLPSASVARVARVTKPRRRK